MPPHPYIAIEGAIGVGKTSLARILGQALSAEILLEVFEENPFLSDFYTDRARYAFQTQIFFLLSRYRQQHRVIVNTVKTSPLVSDYLFAKDWLFAHLNLAGDELAMYERVHSILGEQIPTPNLVVYLKAPTDTLMRRIAFRDRAYERQMSPEYIEALRLAYETFFSEYTAAQSAFRRHRRSGLRSRQRCPDGNRREERKTPSWAMLNSSRFRTCPTRPRHRRTWTPDGGSPISSEFTGCEIENEAPHLTSSLISLASRKNLGEIGPHPQSGLVQAGSDSRSGRKP